MNYHQLTENQRYQIYALLKAGCTQKEVANTIGCSPSTICRELKRNRGLRGYRPTQAQKRSESRRRKAYKHRKVTPEVYGWIVQLLRQELSPVQVVDYLAEHKNVSLHWETVYQLIYEDKAAGGDLYKHMRIASKLYRKRYGSYDRRGRIPNRVGIENRPAIVDAKARIGDWEGDTIVGKGRKSALLTLVERKTLYTVIVKLRGKRADLLSRALIRRMKAMQNKVKTITFDNGLEFADHEEIAEKLSAKIYFANPYASWERGINENTNGLIRQYFPKGTDFSEVSKKQIRFVMDRLNQRPRKTRGGRCPTELFLGKQVNLLAA